MINTPVLQLPDFSEPFILETEASYGGIGAVLMHDKHPIAYLSKALGPKSMGLSIYEKEFLAIILVVQKYRAYLICGTFIVRTDQKSLKYLLEQKIYTPLQHKYMTKLKGYTNTIEYKKGNENMAANVVAQEAIVECTIRPHDVSFYQFESGLVKYKGKVYVGSNTSLRIQIIEFMHQSNIGGHSGVQGTVKRIQTTFLWPGIKQHVKEIVSKSPICQINE